MTALDTNVLVRIITNDDRSQAARAATFLREQERVFISKTVLLELEWVLRSAYKIGPNAIISALHDVLSVFNVEIEDEANVLQHEQHLLAASAVSPRQPRHRRVDFGQAVGGAAISLFVGIDKGF